MPSTNQTFSRVSKTEQKLSAKTSTPQRKRLKKTSAASILHKSSKNQTRYIDPEAPSHPPIPITATWNA